MQIRSNLTVNVDIFALYIFTRYSRFFQCPRKYISRENNLYYAIYRQYCEKREYKSTRDCQFSQIRENLYTRDSSPSFNIYSNYENSFILPGKQVFKGILQLSNDHITLSGSSKIKLQRRRPGPLAYIMKDEIFQ